MSECAISFASKFIVDIGAEELLLHIPQFIRVYTTFTGNLPKVSAQQPITDLEQCVSTSFDKSLADIARTVVINIVSVMVITVLFIIGVILLLINTINPRIQVFLVTFMILIWAWGIYVIHRINNTPPPINIDGCLTNSVRSAIVYKVQVDRATQSALCAY